MSVTATRSRTSGESRQSRVHFGAEECTTYEPSDDSEEWDPNAESDSEDEDGAPSSMGGYLWKKSPSVLVLFKYQSRFFMVKNGKITWWETKRDADTSGSRRSKGCLDLKVNRVSIREHDRIPTKFTIEPADGRWITGNFTGSTTGRKFELDADGSEFSRTDWLSAIRDHIAYGTSK